MKKIVSLLIAILLVVSATPISVSAAATNILLGKKYTHTGTAWYADHSDDSNCTYLTDGKTGGSYTGSEYFGLMKQNAFIEFNFDSPEYVKEIQINHYVATNAGVRTPKYVTISVKTEADGAWQELYMDAYPYLDTLAVFRLPERIKVYGMKFYFMMDSNFLFLKEIMAYDNNTTQTADVSLPAFVDRGTNLAKGKSYTRGVWIHPNYPDTDNKELTDGILGNESYADPAWSGTRKNMSYSGDSHDRWPLHTVTIDLEKVCSVTQVKTNFLRNSVAEIALPDALRIYTSVDGENWSKIAHYSDLNSTVAPNYVFTFGWHYDSNIFGKMTDVTGDPDSIIKARYVRVDFEPRSTHNFIDEITVMGYEGVVSDATTLAKTSKLENDTIQKVSAETGYVQDMVLCYQHDGVTWSKEKFKPILTYVDQNNNSVDTLYDTVLFLAQRYNYERVYDGDNDIVKIDHWNAYIEKCFGEDGDVYLLNEAAKQASSDLNDPDYKANYVIMVPYPAQSAVEFGEVNGRSLDLSVDDDAKYLVEWYLDEVISRIEDGDYDYLDFKGFYWMAEYPSRPNIISYTNSLIKDRNLTSYWIPYYGSTGYFWREYLGFDAVTLQPSHYFNDSYDLGTKFVGAVSKMGGVGNFGVEFEFDGNVMSNVFKYNKFLDYLNAATEYNFDGPGLFRNWYMGGSAVPDLAASKLPDMRKMYDAIYGVIKGTHKVAPYLDNINDNMLSGMTYTHNVDDANWYAERSTDTSTTFLTDGLATGTFYGDAFFGIKNQDATIQFDFTSGKKLSELHIVSFQDSGANVGLAKNLDVYVKLQKNSDTWVKIYSGAVTDKHFVIKSDDITANIYGIKLDFKKNGPFLFLKEIMAFSEPTEINADVPFTYEPAPGDLNGDMAINSDDVTLFKKYFAGFDVEIAETATDVNADGTTNRADLLRLIKNVVNP